MAFAISKGQKLINTGQHKNLSLSSYPEWREVFHVNLVSQQVFIKCVAFIAQAAHAQPAPL